MASMSDTAREDQALEARRQLRKELEPHIAALDTTRSEPPFTLGELIVCAIISHDEKYVAGEDIAEWIMKASTFYAHRAIEKYMTAMRPHEKSLYHGGFTSKSGCPIDGFWDAMIEHDLPLKLQNRLPFADLDFIHSYQGTAGLGHYNKLRRKYRWMRYSIGAGPARVYLRRWLHQPGGHFRFFDLAPELRTRIYKMVLVCDDEPHLAMKGSLVHRRESHLPQFAIYLERYKMLKMCRADTTSTIAVLATCKQARHEARGIFYGLNTFHHQGLSALGKSLLKSSGVNLDVIRRLSLCVNFLPHPGGDQESTDRRVLGLREKVAGVQLLGQLRLDELIFGQASCPVVQNCHPQSHHLGLLSGTLADDSVNTLFTACLHAIVSAARRAKHVTVYPYGDCNALERYIQNCLKEVFSVKMLCCSFPKHRDEDMQYL
ncbi:hypothetical protein AC578_10613 [Pseudocercospora eumusae]|uniref:Fork-head domain-containing protein n=1 Tax=Pseudocercospora eumusae TaxID=321146 RepID=A0A139HKM0_9PEZI|nr:hypothetical protein AC578_10613 [Pseudocercospora eumusae]